MTVMKTNMRLLLLVLSFTMSWFFLAPPKACSWPSNDYIEQWQNSHENICGAAYDALQKDPAMRSDSTYPAPAFPSKGDIMSHVSGPDDDNSVKYSEHVYNSELLRERGGGPEAVNFWYKDLAYLMSDSYGKASAKPGAAKAVAWVAHFIQDLTNPYHVLGMPGAYIHTMNIDRRVTGPIRGKRQLNFDMDVLISRFQQDQQRKRNVDWFDPWYYNGTKDTLDAQIVKSSHTDYEVDSPQGKPPVPQGYGGLWRQGGSSGALAFAQTVAKKTRADVENDSSDQIFNAKSAKTKSLVVRGTECTYSVWRASFSALRPGDLELAAVPGKNVYRLKVRVKNFEDDEHATNVAIRYTIIEGTKRTGYSAPSMIASIAPGGEMDAPAVDIPIPGSNARLEVLLKGDFIRTPDSGEAQREYDITTLVKKAASASATSAGAAAGVVATGGKAALDLTKTANVPRVVAGEEVTYIYRVKNTGGVPLSGVKVEDDRCLVMDPAEADLAPGREQKFRCSMQIFDDTQNTAVAKGFDSDGIEVPSKEVKFKVTVGPPGKVLTPHVLRMTLESAEYKITEANLNMGSIRYRFDDSIPEGEVIEQSPEPGRLVDLGSSVSLVMSRGKERKAERIMVTPPFVTATVGKSVSFTADVVFSDGDVKQWTGLVTWSPGPQNLFTCKEPGKFIVEAQFGDAYGAATVTCEEDWSVPAFTPPITSSGDRGRVPQAAPGDYKWYAFCDPKSGEVTYGEQLQTGRTIMAGPFAGPRTANDWIATNCPRWRCDEKGACATAPAPGRGGAWKVLCGRQDGTIYVGTTHDDAKHILVQQGFLGEPDARAWASSVYPNWQCTADGAPKVAPTTPRMGGNWAVICSRKHGGVGLTQSPDYIDHFVWREGLLGEPDARLWTDLNCPSWRCDSEGRCLPGVARRTPEGRPLEVPSDGPIPEATQEEQRERDKQNYETGRKIGEALGKLVLGGAAAAAGAGQTTQPTQPEKPAGKKPTASSKPPSTTKPGGTTSKYPAGAYSGEWDAPRGTIRDPSGKQAARNCDGVLMGGPIKMTVRADGTVDGELYNYLQSYIYRIKGRVDASGQLNATAECYLYRESICWKEVTSCTLRGTLKSGASGPTGSGTISCGPNSGTSYCTGSWGR